MSFRMDQMLLVFIKLLYDFPEETVATQTNLIDAMVYGTNDSDATGLLDKLGQTHQYNDNGTNANPKSIQRFVDG